VTRKNLLLIPIFFTLLVTSVLFFYVVYAINTGTYLNREPVERYYFEYDIKVTGLSGKEVSGTTVIMVPIPASKEGKFFTPFTQKPDFIQRFLLKIMHKPEQDRIGPYFENISETLDNKEIMGNWVTFIAETDKGHMLGFRTNETRLEDISYGGCFVADYFDIFDPINNGSPMLFPVENMSDVYSTPYGDYTKYASNPKYNTYIYLSDNLKGGENVSFFVYLTANNDPYEWPEKYRGRYNNLLLAKVNDTGYVKVRTIMGQEIPWGNDSLEVMSTQYFSDFYADETSDNVNVTPSYTVVA
jgi:hypothetical protein